MVQESVGLIPGFEEPVLIVANGSSKIVRTLSGAEIQAASVENVREVFLHEFFTEVSVCPLCGRSNGAPIGQVQQLFWKVSLLRCSCGLVRKEKFARDEVLAAIYGECYSNFQAGDRGAAIAANMPRIARLPTQSGRLLDVGCGSGIFVATAQAAGYDAHGIDPFLPENTAGLNGLKKLSVFEAAQDESLGKFDIVTLWAVWEHLGRPVDVLRSAKSLLKPGGILVLNSPAGDSLHARYRANRWYMATLIEHLHFLTHHSLHELTQQLQMVPVSVRSAGVPFPFGSRGLGQAGQGLTIKALSKIFGLENTINLPNSRTSNNVPPAVKSDPIIRGFSKDLIRRLAKHSWAGQIARNALDKTQVGDHLEIMLRKTHH